MIDPTYESNDSVQAIPMRPYDLYTDIDRALEALSEVQAKVIEEAEFYKEMTEVYPLKYQEYLDHDKNITKMDQDTVRYLREKMRVLNSYYDDLTEVDEQMKEKSIIIKYIIRHREESPYLRADMIIGRQFDEIHPWFPSPPKLVRPVPLLFLDDMSHTELYSSGRANPLNNLALRHRHIGGQGYGITIQFATETFKQGVQKALRDNTQQFLLFGTKDQTTVEGMYEGLGSHCTYDEFMKLYNHATAEPHGFLLVDNNTNDPERMFRRNWDTFLVGFVDLTSKKVTVKKTKKNVKHQARDLDEAPAVVVSKKRKSRGDDSLRDDSEEKTDGSYLKKLNKASKIRANKNKLKPQ